MNKPTPPKWPMTYEEYMEWRREEKFEQECDRKEQGSLAFGKVKQDELKELYEEWDYEYKPTYDYFNYVFQELRIKEFDFLEYLEEARHRAYYSSNRPVADAGFNQLACLIYLAMAKGVETPYDHVLKSDKSFEWKLNKLDKNTNSYV